MFMMLQVRDLSLDASFAGEGNREGLLLLQGED
jgi:hypothetical protein